jgi:heme exporter protein C
LKLILLLSSIILGIVLGLYPKPLAPKPLWWKAFALAIVLIAALITISTPLAGNFGDMNWTRNPAVENVPVIVSLDTEYKKSNSNIPSDSKDIEPGYIEVSAFNPSNLFEDRSTSEKILISDSDYRIARNEDSFIANMRFDEYGNAVVDDIQSINPILYFPINPALNQKIKNMNFHVPMSWVATLAFLIGAIFGVRYLRKGKYEFDSISVSSNYVGLAFASIAMVTGMVWAKFNWGMWWSNDPKQVSLAVLLLIYLAYFALRGSMPEGPKKYKVSAVYSIVSFVSAIFFLFVLPRLTPSLHPGGATDDNMGPAVSFGEGILDSNLAIIYYLSLFSYILVYFWMTNLLTRGRLINSRIAELEDKVV